MDVPGPDLRLLRVGAVGHRHGDDRPDPEGADGRAQAGRCGLPPDPAVHLDPPGRPRRGGAIVLVVPGGHGVGGHPGAGDAPGGSGRPSLGAGGARRCPRHGPAGVRAPRYGPGPRIRQGGNDGRAGGGVPAGRPGDPGGAAGHRRSRSPRDASPVPAGAGPAVPREAGGGPRRRRFRRAPTQGSCRPVPRDRRALPHGGSARRSRGVARLPGARRGREAAPGGGPSDLRTARCPTLAGSGGPHRVRPAGDGVTCPSCGAANKAGRKFCVECGAPLAFPCPSCGAPAEATDRFCGECGAAIAGSQAAQPTPHRQAAESPIAERRLVSVLFADLVGFTTLSESRDPEEVRELLSRYFDTSRQLITRYGGTVEKFIGDAVMAVWGTPVAQEDDAERAVRAALDLVAGVTALGAEVGAAELRARVGVLTGEAAVTRGAEG